MAELFDENIVNEIKGCLTKCGETLAVAESVTAGLLQNALASATDASLFFQGGITTYNIGQKSRHLSVEPIHALSCNCVSEKVSREMAANVCQLFNCNWGIGITGYASPVPESGNKLFCFYTVILNSKVIIENKITAAKAKPFFVQIKYVNTLLQAIVHYLKKR